MKMANPKGTTRSLCAVELSNEDEAIRVAQCLARRLAKTSKARPGAVVVVTDEHGNEIYKAVVPSERPVSISQ
jgi:hypothetical protein